MINRGTRVKDIVTQADNLSINDLLTFDNLIPLQNQHLFDDVSSISLDDLKIFPAAKILPGGKVLPKAKFLSKKVYEAIESLLALSFEENLDALLKEIEIKFFTVHLLFVLDCLVNNLIKLKVDSHVTNTITWISQLVHARYNQYYFGNIKVNPDTIDHTKEYLRKRRAKLHIDSTKVNSIPLSVAKNEYFLWVKNQENLLAKQRLEWQEIYFQKLQGALFDESEILHAFIVSESLYKKKYYEYSARELQAALNEMGKTPNSSCTIPYSALLGCQLLEIGFTKEEINTLPKGHILKYEAAIIYAREMAFEPMKKIFENEKLLEEQKSFIENVKNDTKRRIQNEIVKNELQKRVDQLTKIYNEEITKLPNNVQDNILRKVYMSQLTGFSSKLMEFEKSKYSNDKWFASVKNQLKSITSREVIYHNNLVTQDTLENQNNQDNENTQNNKNNPTKLKPITLLENPLTEPELDSACSELRTVTQYDKNNPDTPLKMAGRNVLKKAEMQKDKNLDRQELLVLTKFVKGTTNLIKDQTNDTIITHSNNIEQALSIGIDRQWGKVIGGALLGVFGVALMLGSVAAAIATCGFTAPISGFGFALGAFITIGVGSGLGLGGGALLTAKAGLFSNRASKGDIVLAGEVVLNEVNNLVRYRRQINNK